MFHNNFQIIQNNIRDKSAIKKNETGETGNASTMFVDVLKGDRAAVIQLSKTGRLVDYLLVYIPFY